MEIAIRSHDSIAVVDVKGSLDTGTAPTLASAFEDLQSGGAAKILVVLDAVDFVSSAGLRVLLATAKKLRRQAGDLRLSGLNESVKEVFEISGFDSILRTFESESQALEDF
jgi:anti-sigma B factor antagonist